MNNVNDIDYRWNRIGEIINSYGKEDDKIAWMLCRGDSAEWKIKYKELEQQNKELKEIAKEYSYLLLSQQAYDFNNEHDLKRGEEIETLLENIT